MSEQEITFSQFWSEIGRTDKDGNPVKFSLIFVSADEKRGTGGDFYVFGHKTTFIQMFLAKHKKDTVYTDSLVFKVVGAHNGQPKLAIQNNPEANASRDPHHWSNQTMNIMVSTSRQIRKVHPILILYYNDKKVI